MKEKVYIVRKFIINISFTETFCCGTSDYSNFKRYLNAIKEDPTSLKSNEATIVSIYFDKSLANTKAKSLGNKVNVKNSLLDEFSGFWEEYKYDINGFYHDVKEEELEVEFDIITKKYMAYIDGNMFKILDKKPKQECEHFELQKLDQSESESSL